MKKLLIFILPLVLGGCCASDTTPLYHFKILLYILLSGFTYMVFFFTADELDLYKYGTHIIWVGIVIYLILMFLISQIGGIK